MTQTITSIAERLQGGTYFRSSHLDRKSEKYVDDDDGKFVQICVNNGLKQYKSLHFKKCCKWGGLPFDYDKEFLL